MNILDYIEKYKDMELDIPNEIDALIFSRISYIHIEDLEDKLPFTIEDLNNYKKNIKINSMDNKLLDLLSKANRFRNIIISRCKNILDQEKEEQFMAITFVLSKNNLFIAYRGTNKNIIGYKEDLNLSYKEVPSQRDALSYLEEESIVKNIYLGGHSKGGNLAMYALINASYLRRQKIKKVYNFDGPGFLSLGKRFESVKKKIINYYPNYSIVGMMMENSSDSVVIKSTKKGIEAHNLYSWEVMDNHFTEDKLSSNSILFHRSVKELLEKINAKRRETIINSLFNLLMKRKISFKEGFDIQKILSLVSEVPSLSKEEKEALNKFIKVFVKVSIGDIKASK